MIKYAVCVCTSRKEPVSVLNDRLNDSNNLQGHGGHHLCHVSGKRETNLPEIQLVSIKVDRKKYKENLCIIIITSLFKVSC